MSGTLRVNPIACDAHGACAELLPEMITLDEWGYPILDPRPVPPALDKHARAAVSACPTLALRLTRELPAGTGSSQGRGPESPGRSAQWGSRGLPEPGGVRGGVPPGKHLRGRRSYPRVAIPAKPLRLTRRGSTAASGASCPGQATVRG
jgi:ferredoxin